MSTLRVRNHSEAGTLIVRVWHPSNPCMSDGDLPWIDEDGAPTGTRTRDHSVPPGEALEFAAQDELALTVLTAAEGEPKGIVDSVRRYFRTGSTDPGTTVDPVHAAPFSLANMGTAPLRVRVFASATLQLSPLRECSLAPGETTKLSTGEDGISVRLGRPTHRVP